MMGKFVGFDLLVKQNFRKFPVKNTNLSEALFTSVFGLILRCNIFFADNLICNFKIISDL